METSNNILDYATYAAYAAEGLVICLGNSLLFLAIMSEKSLRRRKEMLIVAGLCAADIVYGLGTLLLNIYRIVLIILGLQSSPSTAWKCVTMPHVFMAKIGGQLTATMNLVVSVDRYIAIAYPLKYRKMNVTYAKILLGCVFLYFLISSSIMILSTYFDEPIFTTYSAICVNAVFPRWYALYDSTFIVGIGGLSVIVYFCVFLAYRSYLHQVSSGKASDQQTKVQRRLTVTLGMISMCTLIFYVIPFGITAYYVWKSIKTPYTIPLAMLTRVSTIVNLVIYIYRQKEVRPGILGILCCNKEAERDRRRRKCTVDHERLSGLALERLLGSSPERTQNRPQPNENSENSNSSLLRPEVYQ